MALHVRHNAKSSAEAHLLLSLLFVILLGVTAFITSRQITQLNREQSGGVSIAIELPRAEQTEAVYRVDIPECELPPAPALYEPKPLSFPSASDFTTDGDTFDISEEENVHLFAKLSPEELPQEVRSEPQKAPSVKKVEGKINYTPPQYAATPQPPYPSELQRQRLNGKVRVRIQINAHGKPTAVEVLDATHPAFAKAALQTIRTAWRFSPAQENGKAVAAAVTTTIFFKL